MTQPCQSSFGLCHQDTHPLETRPQSLASTRRLLVRPRSSACSTFARAARTSSETDSCAPTGRNRQLRSPHRRSHRRAPFSPLSFLHTSRRMASVACRPIHSEGDFHTDRSGRFRRQQDPRRRQRRPRPVEHYRLVSSSLFNRFLVTSISCLRSTWGASLLSPSFRASQYSRHSASHNSS